MLLSCNCCQIFLFCVLQTLKEHTHGWTAWSQSDGRAGSSLPGSETESLKLDSLSILAVCNCCQSRHLGYSRFECNHLGSFKKSRAPARKGVKQNHHEANPALSQAVVDSFSNSLGGLLLTPNSFSSTLCFLSVVCVAHCCSHGSESQLTCGAPVL
jgi:hypothetical protein